MFDYILDLLTVSGPWLIAQNPVVLPNPFGEAIAASARDITNLIFRKRQLELQERQIDSLERRRQFINSLERLELLRAISEPGVVLGEQHPVIQEGFSEFFGVDVATNPQLANVQINPLSFQDRLAQTQLEVLARLEEEDPEAAQAVRERFALGGETVEEVLASQGEAEIRTRTHSIIGNIMGRVAEGEGSPEDVRLVRNIISEETGTPFQIEAIGPGGRSLVVDEDIASTLVSAWWQTAREGQSDSQQALSDLSSSLVEAMDSLGFAIDEGLASTVLTAINNGDREALEEVASRGPAAQTTVDVALRGRARVDAFSQLWLSSLPPIVRESVQAGLGQLVALRQSGAPKEELVELSKSISESAKVVAERQGIDPDSIPLITNPSALLDIVGGAALGGAIGAGVGSFAPGIGTLLGGAGGALLGAGIGRLRSGGTEFQPGQRQQGRVTLSDLVGSEAEEAEGSTARDNELAQVVVDIRGGNTTLSQARREHDLTPEEVRAIRRILGGGG